MIVRLATLARYADLVALLMALFLMLALLSRAPVEHGAGLHGPAQPLPALSSRTA